MVAAIGWLKRTSSSRRRVDRMVRIESDGTDRIGWYGSNRMVRIESDGAYRIGWYGSNRTERIESDGRLAEEDVVGGMDGIDGMEGIVGARHG
jgi:hypothetical protein